MRFFLGLDLHDFPDVERKSCISDLILKNTERGLCAFDLVSDLCKPVLKNDDRIEILCLVQEFCKLLLLNP